MRYLGMAVVLGLGTVFGTLIPPIFQCDFAAILLDTPSGQIILLGLVATPAGMVVVALALGPLVFGPVIIGYGNVIAWAAVARGGR